MRICCRISWLRAGTHLAQRSRCPNGSGLTRVQTFNVIEILNLANGECVDLKVEKGRLLMRGALSARPWAHLRDACVVLCDEIPRQEGIAWVKVYGVFVL